MLTYRKGDLIEAFKAGEVGAIGHQSNCFNTMGSGVALAIKNAFPAAYEADCATIKGDLGKLGSMTCAFTPKGPIFNLYGQYRYGKDGALYTDYSELGRAMEAMRFVLDMAEHDKPVGFPKIGCGTAGGDWGIVSAIIETIFEGMEVIIYEI
jgi:O-acetyl-ADP-ribose deacetylase (regulator of RNase III)